ncbi:CBS domain-containing protein [Blastococcus sp. TF02A-26]|uniref:CBS domain-containing protein n=1 Tax=Blastococcus sp. TF02A-26 TaxID=2250577 RepID=UPI000DEA371A|nr:CBS domain-containing protein [Blastococcus sp. TF02A-26]RBY80741.1 histidine kinase [Blastococcus sp. TF02A-26]
MQIAQLLRHKGPEVATVDREATVAAALALLAERGIGALVVSPDGRSIEGIVTERDVVRALPERGPALLDQPVSALMTPDVRTCVPTASVHDLARTMTDHRIRHVPVVEDGAMVGIVSIGDVVKARLDELEQERAQLVDYIQTA